MARKRVAILISGRGSNMAALIAAAESPSYPAEIVLVVSSRTSAAGLARAEEAGIPTAIVEARARPDRATFEAAIERRLVEARVDLIALAGFMCILSAGFVTRWRGRLINIHPSLLPAFPGLDTHARVLATGARRHGCTVHFVTEGVDDGPIIAQSEVVIMPGDTPDALADRVLLAEHKLYPKALEMVALGRVRL